MRKINTKKPKTPLSVSADSFTLIASEEDQISKITEFFDDLYSSDDTVTSEQTISVTSDKLE